MTSIKTILHIGIAKAGTSTIQHFFRERREELLKYNILYPLDVIKGNQLGGDNHKCLAMVCTKYNKQNIVFKQQRVSSEKEKRELSQRLIKLYTEQFKNMSNDITCILSAEHFWSELRTEESIICLKHNLEKLNIKIEKIIIYLREQVQWLKSYIQQKLIEGSATSLEIPFKNDQIIKSRLDYFETIQLWNDIFPEVTIVPRIFDSKMFEGGTLMSDFLNVCGKNDVIQHYGNTDFKSASNVSSLTLEGYLLLALFNKYEKSSQNSSFNKYGTYTSQRKAIMEYLRTNFSGKPDYFFTEDIVSHIRELFKDSNAKLRKKYFNSYNVLFDDNYLEKLPKSPILNELPDSKLVEYLYNSVI